jgi:hypothetical protein
VVSISEGELADWKLLCSSDSVWQSALRPVGIIANARFMSQILLFSPDSIEMPKYSDPLAVNNSARHQFSSGFEAKPLVRILKDSLSLSK